MPDESIRRPPERSTRNHDTRHQMPPVFGASSTLKGRVDYADLAEHVSRGITVDLRSRSGTKASIDLGARWKLIIPIAEV